MTILDVAPELGTNWHPRIPDADVCRNRVALLTNTEWRILDLLAFGYRIKEVSRLRGVSVQTTRNQLNSASRKLDVQGVTEALAVIRRAEQVA